MNKLLQIKTLATEKGCRIQESMHSSGLNMIGICLPKQHVYHWFTHFKGEHFRFDHSYSMNTGATKRGLMYGLRKKIALQKMLGITFND